MNDHSIKKILYKPCNRREFVKDTLAGIGSFTIGSFIIINQSGCSDNTNPVTPNGQDITFMVDISLSENSALQQVGGTVALSLIHI